MSLHVPISTNNAANFSDLHNRIRNLQRRLDVDTASIADSSLDGSSVTDRTPFRSEKISIGHGDRFRRCA